MTHALKLAEALELIADGDEPRPVGLPFRSDGVTSKNDKCVHGVTMNETCGECIADYARAALAEYRQAQPSRLQGVGLIEIQTLRRYLRTIIEQSKGDGPPYATRLLKCLVASRGAVEIVEGMLP